MQLALSTRSRAAGTKLRLLYRFAFGYKLHKGRKMMNAGHHTYFIDNRSIHVGCRYSPYYKCDKQTTVSNSCTMTCQSPMSCTSVTQKPFRDSSEPPRGPNPSPLKHFQPAGTRIRILYCFCFRDLDSAHTAFALLPGPRGIKIQKTHLHDLHMNQSISLFPANHSFVCRTYLRTHRKSRRRGSPLKHLPTTHTQTII